GLTPSLQIHMLARLCSRHPATTGFYTLSLHDALPIYHFLVAAVRRRRGHPWGQPHASSRAFVARLPPGMPPPPPHRFHGENYWGDRKSTRLNSSHVKISYAVLCLKKKRPPRNCFPLLL